MTSNDFTDRDIDRLLRGDANDALADTAPSIETLRSLAVSPTPADAERAGAALASVAAGAAQAPAAVTAPTRAPWKVRAAVAGVLSLALAGFAGTAASADDAAPGDVLYSLDRALEGLGLFDGGLEERIEEALKLDANGEIEAALEHVAEALAALDEDEAADETAEETAEDESTDEAAEETTEDEVTEDETTEPTDEAAEETTEDETTESTEESTDDEVTEATKNKEACDALLAAAAKLRENGSEASADVHARVSEMLTWMATTDARGRDFGHGVSMRAHGIHDEDGDRVKDKSWKDADETVEAADEETETASDDPALAEGTLTEDETVADGERQPAKETERATTEGNRTQGSSEQDDKGSWNQGNGKGQGSNADDRDAKRGSGNGFSKSGGESRGGSERGSGGR